jgi:hypothetical protein
LKQKKEPVGGTGGGKNWFTQDMISIIVGIVVVINSHCGLSFPAAKEPMGRLLISRYSIFQADLKICFTGKSKILIKSCAFL